MGRLEGKVAIVTGSSSGIGRAVAERFSREGARVVVNSSTSVAAGTELAGALDDAIYVQGDVSRESDVRRLIAAAVERWGGIDVLVNNAGATRTIPHHDLDAVTLDVWKDVFGVNVFGSWLMCREAVPHLKRSSAGTIINISSLSAMVCIGSSIPYAVSKAALNHMTRLLSRVVGPEVSANVIAPGFIDTPWTSQHEEARQKVVDTSPLGRTGTVDDIADAALYLTTARYVTGQVLTVDGGVGQEHTLSPSMPDGHDASGS